VPKLDLTVNLTSMLAIAGLLWAVLKMANKGQIQAEIASYAADVRTAQQALGAADEKHAAHDDTRFEGINSKLDAIKDNIAQALDAGRRVDRMEGQLAGMRDRMDQMVASTEKRFAEDRQIEHDRYEKQVTPLILKVGAQAESIKASQEQILQRIDKLEAFQMLAPKELKGKENTD
jgi:hypothetical protein